MKKDALSSKENKDNCWLEQSPEKSTVSTVPFFIGPPGIINWPYRILTHIRKIDTMYCVEHAFYTFFHHISLKALKLCRSGYWMFAVVYSILSSVLCSLLFKHSNSLEEDLLGVRRCFRKYIAFVPNNTIIRASRANRTSNLFPRTRESLSTTLENAVKTYFEAHFRSSEHGERKLLG